jgi:hypothetical protein
MADRNNTDRIAGSPHLLSPRSETVVEARDVTLKWESAEGATTYRVQVATDSTFEDLVVDEEVGDTTELRLTDAFQSDGDTFFWRVLSGNEAGWSRGNVVESFIASSASQAASAPQTVEEDEKFGPPGALFRSAAETVAAEVTGDTEAYEEEGAEESVEFDYIESGQILAIAAVVLVAVAMIAVVLFQWTNFRHDTVLTEFTGKSGYPELRETKTNATRLLSNFEVVDAEAGVYRIPIDRAMTIMANEAFLDRDRPLTNEIDILPRRAQETQ